MKNSTLLAAATAVAASFAFAAPSSAAIKSTLVEAPAPVVQAADTVEVAQAQTRAERRAARQARRAERRAARRAARGATSNDAPFGFLSDGVTPRTQPITRSDQRFIDNGNQIVPFSSFSDFNRR